MGRRSILSSALFILCSIVQCSLLGASAYGQNAGGTLMGTITDPYGEAVANASVQATNEASRTVYKAVSLANGTYSLSELPAGTYDVSVSMPGFKPFQNEKIVVRTGLSSRTDIQLREAAEGRSTLGTLGEDRVGFGILMARKPNVPSGPTPRLADGKPDLSGIWSALSPDKPPEVVPLPWAEALIKERQENHLKDSPGSRCLPQFQIFLPLLHSKFIHTPSLLVALLEYENPSHREIFLDGRNHPKDLEAGWTGHSIGKWDGDTLVVDTVGFNDKSWLMIPGQPPQGHPHTEMLHIVQRFRRVDLGHMEVEVTLEDPGAYQKPFTATGVSILLPNEQIDEYVCNENNVDAEHLVGK